MAVTVSPLMSYAFVQRYKANRIKKGKKPTNLFQGNLAGVITFVLTLGFWFKYDHDVEAAVYMALTIGILQPFIVAWIMGKLKKRLPDVYIKMQYGTDDTTAFTPFKKKPEVDFDVTGANGL